jgi:hypothetical protein
MGRVEVVRNELQSVLVSYQDHSSLEPYFQSVDRLAPSYPLKLLRELFGKSLWIFLFIFVRSVIPLCHQNVGHTRLVEYLQELTRSSDPGVF